MYSGSWDSGVMHGAGIEFDTDTEFKIYEGEFCKDFYEGRGNHF